MVTPEPVTDLVADAEPPPAVDRAKSPEIGSRRVWIPARRLPELIAALFASLCFALTFGLNYGINNQVAYLLGSLSLVEPGVFARDWYANQTTHYHPAFTYLGGLLLAIDGSGWSIAVAHLVVITAGALMIYWLLTLLVEPRLAIACFLLVLAINVITATRSVAVSYVFDFIFQPSTLASLGFLAALPPFLVGRWLLSGTLLAIAGLFHANFLILAFPVFGLTHVLLGKRGLYARLLRQLGPAVAVILLLSPLLFRSTASADAAAAQEIYFKIRSPHHYLPSSYERDFFPFAAWHLVGLGAGWSLLRSISDRTARLGALVTSLVAVVWVGTVLTTTVWIPRVSQVFVWRLAPFCELLFQVMAAIAVVRFAAHPAKTRRLPSAASVALCAGVSILLMFAGNHKQTGLVRLLFLVVAAVAVAQVARLLERRWAEKRIVATIRGAWSKAAGIVLSAGAALLLYDAAAEPLTTVKTRSSLLTGIGRGEQELCSWMRTETPKDALFLTPPGVETIRFHGQRAIVVDWKSAPIVPGDVVEWYRRIIDVTGRPRFAGAKDIAGYDSLDQARLDELHAKYGFDYVVVRNRGERRLTGKLVFQNGAFSVLELPKGAPQSAVFQ